MALTKVFNGVTLRKPGSYSRFSVDNKAGSALGSSDILFLIGESTAGAGGATTGITEFAAENLADLIAYYGSGPIVDCAVAAARPSKTPGIGAPGRFMVYKTNPSVQATATLMKSTDDVFTVKGRAYGAGDNNYSIVVAAGSSARQKTISITELAGTTESLGENEANVIMTLVYTGNGSAATVAITGASRQAQVLATTLTGESDGSEDLSINLADYTMKELVDYINEQEGYTATLVTATEGPSPATDLDKVSSTSIKSPTTVSFYKLQVEILDLINTSIRVEAVETDNLGGVPDNQTLPLTGGAQGASTNAFFSAGLSASLAKEYNVCVPCVSRDASVDIADAVDGFTNASSTYTMAGISAALSAHLTLRGSIKNRKEAQAFLGYRHATAATALNFAAGLNDYNIQTPIQDVMFLDAEGEIRVGHPHIFAAMAAGIRLGSPVGEPLTHKLLNTTGVGHFISSETLLETGDFNPGTDGDDAIDSGVLYAEQKGASYRIVVDNTTYGQDNSFVYNRGSVVEASYYVFKTLRETAEQLFVGRKVSNGLALSIKNAIRNKLRELNQPDVQIITSSDDAPEGFKEDTFTVSISGNTCTINVEFKPCQGLDWVLFNFTLGDITQSA